MPIRKPITCFHEISEYMWFWNLGEGKGIEKILLDFSTYKMVSKAKGVDKIIKGRVGRFRKDGCKDYALNITNF